MFFVELQQCADFTDVQSVSGLVLNKSFDDFCQEVTVSVLECLQLVAQLGPAERKCAPVVQVVMEFFEVSDRQDGETQTERVSLMDVDLRVGVGLLQSFELFRRFVNQKIYLRSSFP